MRSVLTWPTVQVTAALGATFCLVSGVSWAVALWWGRGVGATSADATPVNAELTATSAASRIPPRLIAFTDHGPFARIGRDHGSGVKLGTSTPSWAAGASFGRRGGGVGVFCVLAAGFLRRWRVPKSLSVTHCPHSGRGRVFGRRGRGFRDEGARLPIPGVGSGNGIIIRHRYCSAFPDPIPRSAHSRDGRASASLRCHRRRLRRAARARCVRFQDGRAVPPAMKVTPGPSRAEGGAVVSATDQVDACSLRGLAANWMARRSGGLRVCCCSGHRVALGVGGCGVQVPVEVVDAGFE